MWPWAHAALGYLCYTLYVQGRWGDRPAGWPVVALGIGTQIPDLVDKIGAWYLQVLPHGRTLAHSLLIALPVVTLVLWWSRRRGHGAVGVAFGLGYLSHLLGDSLFALVTQQWADLGFLLWPLVAPPPTELQGLVPHLRNIEGSPFFLFGLGLTVAMFALWNWHGRPGLDELRSLNPARTGQTELGDQR